MCSLVWGVHTIYKQAANHTRLNLRHGVLSHMVEDVMCHHMIVI